MWVWGHVQKWAGRWRAYFGYEVSEIGLHVNLSIIIYDKNRTMIFLLCITQKGLG